MRTLFGLGTLAVLALAGLVGACSDGQPESVVDGGAAAGKSSGGSHTGGGAATAGTPSFGAIGPAMGGTNGNGGSDGTGGIEQCAAANQQAELSPVYLVFLLDESGSMGDGRNGDRTEKWDPVTAALKAFFADQESAGIMASLSVFPLNKNMTMGSASQGEEPDCSAEAYVDPLVKPKPLPDDKTFADAIALLDPPNEYGTPTMPALTGTIQYAESLLAEDAERKVAVVMVTDGQPTRCDDDDVNTIANTAAAAAAVADRIPTYVIGVGKELEALDSIAHGGGTDKAFIVDIDDSEDTRKSLLAAINLIRGKSISCKLEIPAPPPGKTLDPDKVDVQFSGDGKPASSLKYGTECTGDVAWHYDDPQAPTSIQLCDAACETVKADTKGKLDVVFGCVDRVVVN